MTKVIRTHLVGKYLDYGEYRINFVAVWICSSCIVFLYNRRKTSL